MSSAAPATYVPTWVKSNCSFLVGASHPEELVDAAWQAGLPALCLTDRHGVYGAVRAHVRAKLRGLALVVGAELWLGGEPVVALAMDRRGYGGLCRLLSQAHQGGAKGDCQVDLEALCAAAPGLALLAGGNNLSAPGGEALAEAFGDRLYALCSRHLLPGDAAREAATLVHARRLGATPLAATEVLYHRRERGPLQAVMTCIRHRTQLHHAGRRLAANFEHALPSPARMAALFADRPAWLAASLELAGRCTFRLDDLDYRYPQALAGDASLRRHAQAGARARYGQRLPAAVARQLEDELQLVAELGYAPYFLTMHEVVGYCQSEGILCQGRGSAANSIICYSLGITAIDPVGMQLLFARFISRERAEPPDIDLDIEHHRREQVIQWVYRRFGRRHAAMVANVVRFRLASAVREVGLAWGLGAACVRTLGQRLHAGEPACQVVPAAWRPLAIDLLDMPRHLSVHPGGFLLGAAPVDTLVPVEQATMPGRTVIQWDKSDVEDMRLFKLDLLGLGALSHIRGAFAEIANGPPTSLIPRSLAEVPQEDPRTYEMLCRGDAVGVFQLESRAQMAMLPRLRPMTFYDLVVEVAIVRPGPIQGDMVHPYLRRRAGEAPVELPHPRLADILNKTFGVPIFQEQVMKIAILCARYSPGEADQLRRDMAAWRSSTRILAHHDRLVGRMVEAGIGRDFAENIFRQIRGFGEYGFPESHAASFAHIAYVTAWLKCHHPAAFTCALLNAQPMGFYSPSTLVEDARRHAVEVRPLCVNRSGWACSLEAGADVSADAGVGPGAAAGGGRMAESGVADAGPALRMGLRFVRGLGEAQGRALAAAAPYASLADLGRRGGVSPALQARLARAGALAALQPRRRQALWASAGITAWRSDELPLEDALAAPSLPPLRREQAIAWDRLAAGHSALGHPMAALRPELDRAGVWTARTLQQAAAAVPPAPPPAAQRGGLRRRGPRGVVVGLVICRQQPETAGGVLFLTLEDETGCTNVVVWPRVLARCTALARAAACLAVVGELQMAHQVVHLIAEAIWRPERLPLAGGLPAGRHTR